MGGRVTANLRNLSQYNIAYVEASPERQKEMAADGIETTPLEQALRLSGGSSFSPSLIDSSARSPRRLSPK